MDLKTFLMIQDFTHWGGNSCNFWQQFTFTSKKINFIFRPEDKIKQMERRITELIDEACLAENKSDFKTALAKAKEASARERSLIRMQEQAGLSDSHNLDLTFLVSNF